MDSPAISPPTRPVVMGGNGMVVSGHGLASSAGVRVLMEGGNAFDAALATASTLGVVEPRMSGVGGVGSALAYVAREGRVRALDFSGRAAGAAQVDLYTSETKQVGILSPLLPGTVAGWLTLHETYGTMDREQLFQTAIGYAEEGFPVTHMAHRLIERGVDTLSRFPTSASIMLTSQGRAPAVGARLKMPQLAESMRLIAEGGRDAFYRGELTERMVKASQEMGGLFTEEDFADYEARWQEPVRVSYRGYEVVATPPNSGGFQILQTLKLLEGFGVQDLVYQHPDTLHLMMEAVKLCVTDRIAYGGDPDHVTIPLDALLSESYASSQRARIDRERASSVPGEHFTLSTPPGSLEPGDIESATGGMTTHFAVADRDGNVVTVTQTLGGGFGSGIAIGDTGIFLNNMAYWFDLEEGGPNTIGPRKRVDFVLAPTQTFQGGRFAASMGTPGGWGILHTTVQSLMGILDFGLNVQQAIESPLFRVHGGRAVDMEERFPHHVRRALQDRGHEVTTVGPWEDGTSAQGIVADHEAGVLHGGSDPRRDGQAIGW